MIRRVRWRCLWVEEAYSHIATWLYVLQPLAASQSAAALTTTRISPAQRARRPTGGRSRATGASTCGRGRPSWPRPGMASSRTPAPHTARASPTAGPVTERGLLASASAGAQHCRGFRGLRGFCSAATGLRRAFVIPLIRFIPYPLIYSVPLFLNRQCDRTLDALGEGAR